MVRRFIAGAGGAALAVMLSQFPEYAQQYTQRLGGAVDELRVITEDFDRAAEAGGLNRAEAIERYSVSNDDFLAGRGTSMTATDKILDFSRAEGDRIDLSGFDANTGTAQRDGFSFVGTAVFTKKAGELRYDNVGGYWNVAGDTNGDGVADFVLNVSKGSGALIATDFVL